MKEQKIFYLALAIFFLISLVSLFVSYNFLQKNLKKVSTVDSSKVKIYEVELDVVRFEKIYKKLKESE